MGEQLIKENLVSVIVPVYNCEKYIEECLDSILNNTYKNLEVIVVNDGSTDKSADIIKEYYNPTTSKFDKRVIYVWQNNRGLSAARNVGLTYAKGDWISFVDADDVLHPLFYAKMMSCLESPVNKEIDIIESGIHKFNILDKPSVNLEECTWNKGDFWLGSVGSFSKSSNLTEKLNHIEKYPYEGVMQMNKLYNRRIFKFVQYPEGLIHEDEYVIYEEMKYSRIVEYINLRLYGYRVGREGSITNTVKPKNLEDMVASRGHVIEKVAMDSVNKELFKADANDWIKFELTKMLNDLIYLYPKVEKTVGVEEAIEKTQVLYKKFKYTLPKKFKYEIFFKAPKLMELYIKNKR